MFLKLCLLDFLLVVLLLHQSDAQICYGGNITDKRLMDHFWNSNCDQVQGGFRIRDNSVSDEVLNDPRMPQIRLILGGGIIIRNTSLTRLNFLDSVQLVSYKFLKGPAILIVNNPLLTDLKLTSLTRIGLSKDYNRSQKAIIIKNNGPFLFRHNYYDRLKRQFKNKIKMDMDKDDAPIFTEEMLDLAMLIALPFIFTIAGIDFLKWNRINKKKQKAKEMESKRARTWKDNVVKRRLMSMVKELLLKDPSTWRKEMQDISRIDPDSVDTMKRSCYEKAKSLMNSFWGRLSENLAIVREVILAIKGSPYDNNVEEMIFLFEHSELAWHALTNAPQIDFLLKNIPSYFEQADTKLAKLTAQETVRLKKLAAQEEKMNEIKDMGNRAYRNVDRTLAGPCVDASMSTMTTKAYRDIPVDINDAKVNARKRYKAEPENVAVYEKQLTISTRLKISYELLETKTPTDCHNELVYEMRNYQTGGDYVTKQLTLKHVKTGWSLATGPTSDYLNLINIFDKYDNAAFVVARGYWQKRVIHHVQRVYRCLCTPLDATEDPVSFRDLCLMSIWDYDDVTAWFSSPDWILYSMMIVLKMAQELLESELLEEDKLMLKSWMRMYEQMQKELAKNNPGLQLLNDHYKPDERVANMRKGRVPSMKQIAIDKRNPRLNLGTFNEVYCRPRAEPCAVVSQWPQGNNPDVKQNQSPVSLMGGQASYDADMKENAKAKQHEKLAMEKKMERDVMFRKMRKDRFGLPPLPEKEAKKKRFGYGARHN